MKADQMAVSSVDPKVDHWAAWMVAYSVEMKAALTVANSAVH